LCSTRSDETAKCSPAARIAFDRSPIRSRFGLILTAVQSLTPLSNMAKPSWCSTMHCQDKLQERVCRMWLSFRKEDTTRKGMFLACCGKGPAEMSYTAGVCASALISPESCCPECSLIRRPLLRRPILGLPLVHHLRPIREPHRGRSF